MDYFTRFSFSTMIGSPSLETNSVGRSRLGTGLESTQFDRTDRILLGACVAVWLVALGAAAAATVALVDLGTGRAQPTGESDTPWLLYAVIAISAAVIIGAVPLLLRARRAALEESPPPARAPMRAAPNHPEAPARVPGHRDRVPDVRLGGERRDPEPFGGSKAGRGLRWGQGPRGRRLGVRHVLLDFRRDDLGRMLEILELVTGTVRPALARA